MLVGIIDDDLNFIEIFKKEYYPKLITLSNDNDNELIASTIMLSNEVLNALDVVFFDIQLKDKISIELIKKFNFDTKIVFLSSKNNLVFDALKVKPLTFIRKNNIEEDFEIFVELFKNDLVKRRYIELNYNGVLEKVLIDRIQYINACGHDVTVKTSDKEYALISSLKRMLALINDRRFVQIQKSICINVQYVSELNKDHVVMKNGMDIHVSRLFKNKLREKYMEYLLDHHV